MPRHEPITWTDIAKMLCYSDRVEALAEANAAIAFALPGYGWEISRDPDDPLDREKFGLEARPQRGM